MFTGIISNQAIVTKKEKKGGQIRFGFSFKRNEKRPLELGESIAVNGVCLTVAAKTGKGFEADVMGETLRCTAMEDLEAGETVNTERSLRFGDAVGGHYLSGHVDGTGVIEKIEKEGLNVSYWINAPAEFKKFLAAKIQDVKGTLFKVSIVPHTLKETALAARTKKQQVNLEMDRSIRPAFTGRLKIAALQKQGF
jgi:riboflavin synthase